MAATQNIFRIRRQYNQWVVNQTLEDYALRFTAKSARRWSIGKVAMTALGTTAFLALEALGGTVTLQYGMINAVAAITIVCTLIFVIGLPICLYAARYGVDIDLLTRGAGFGYLGSTITSLVYASFTFIFFAIEAAIMAVALELILGIPISLGYVVCALVVIPIVTHGFTFISRFQIGSQYLWLVLQVAALILVVVHDARAIPDWRAFPGEDGVAHFDVLVFGAAAAVLIALVAQLGEQVDYLRFLPRRTPENRRAWLTAVVLAGPGWVFIGFVKLLLGSFVAYVMFSGGAPDAAAADPTHMYAHIYAYFHDAPHLPLVLAGLMVILCQMKINVTNAYAGSIAWSNFFSRLTHAHPGRVVWLVFNVGIALLLMELGIYQVLESVLGLFALVALAWLATLAADLGINKPLGLSPRHIEFKRAHLYDVNPVGVTSMGVASLVGILAFIGEFGDLAQALAHFITLGVVLIVTPAMAWWTRGRYYVARTSAGSLPLTEIHQCCVCEHEYEVEDMAHCPAYSGAICSLCCSLDGRCMDRCKQGARFAEQLRGFMDRMLPAPVVRAAFSQVGRFAGLFSLSALLLAGVLALVSFAVGGHGEDTRGLMDNALWVLFFMFSILAGVLVWLFLLTNESRVVAQQESYRQNKRLLAEIEAHNRTDRELQAAKEHAEAASLAKSRYLSGISHEFRTPLQSILGYAQMLRIDKEMDRGRRRAVDVIHRSSEHLADLIEGLLDVSRIESGRIELRSEVVDLPELLNQMEQIFRPLAAAKGIAFYIRIDRQVPTFVNADAKRLRQILTNLLSNAVKFTAAGEVCLAARFRSEVAEFEVSDTGIGIDAGDLETVFKPFERVAQTGHTSGTGLGLTIVKLLTEVMGGDVSIASKAGGGSTFTVSLYLPRATRAPAPQTSQPKIVGYAGRLRTVMVVDDDPVQRGMIGDLLGPLGFDVVEARSGMHCLKLIASQNVDLFLLDVSMPGMDGLRLAASLRARGVRATIFMVSANAHEPPEVPNEHTGYDAYLVKPLRLTTLLDRIGETLDLIWVREEGADTGIDDVKLDREVCAVLVSHAEIGYAQGVRTALDQYVSADRMPAAFAERLHAHLDAIQFDELINAVEGASS